MVRPILEYGSSVWDPHPDKLQEELEKVQNRAARFVTRNYVYETWSMSDILGQLKWESIKIRRKDNRPVRRNTGKHRNTLISNSNHQNAMDAGSPAILDSNWPAILCRHIFACKSQSKTIC